MSEIDEAANTDDGGSVDDLADEGAPGTADSTEGSQPRWRRVRWVFTRRLCFGGLAGALVLFCLSFTPSLVPRTWLFQGLVGGVSAIIARSRYVRGHQESHPA